MARKEKRAHSYFSALPHKTYKNRAKYYVFAPIQKFLQSIPLGGKRGPPPLLRPLFCREMAAGPNSIHYSLMLLRSWTWKGKRGGPKDSRTQFVLSLRMKIRPTGHSTHNGPIPESLLVPEQIKNYYYYKQAVLFPVPVNFPKAGRMNNKTWRVNPSSQALDH